MDETAGICRVSGRFGSFGFGFDFGFGFEFGFGFGLMVDGWMGVSHNDLYGI